MRNLNRSPRTNLPQLSGIKPLLIMISRTLAKILHATIPIPILPAKSLPVVKGRLGSGDPGEVVGAGRTAEDFSARVGLLDALVVVALDHGGLVGPVVLAAAEVEGLGGGGDFGDLVRVGDAGFDDEDAGVGVFGETACYSVSCSAAADDDEVVFISVCDEGHFAELNLMS